MCQHTCDAKSNRQKIALEEVHHNPAGRSGAVEVTNVLPATWARLPADLLCQVTDLSGGPSHRLRLVCRSWRRALDMHTTHLSPNSCMTPFWVRLPRLFPNLQSLDLSQVSRDLNDGLMIVINSLSSLMTLRLSMCEHVSHMGLQNCIMDLTRLQELDLSGCANVMEEGLTHIALMDGLHTVGRLRQGLTSLNVSHCGLTEDNCIILSHMIALKSLHLDGCPTTSSGLSKLTSLVSLEALSLVACQIDDSGVEQIAVFSRLQCLDLSRNPSVLGHSMGLLASNLPNLLDLRLQCCRDLSSDAVVEMRGFSLLAFLNLRGCMHIGDAAMRQLREDGIPCLAVLNLEECHAITNRGLQDLSGVHSLRYVSLKGCGHVTRSGVDYLVKAGIDVLAEGIGSMLVNHGN